MHIPVVLCLTLLLIGWPVRSHAQSAGGGASAEGSSSMTALRTDAAFSIDAQLDEEPWSQAQPVSGFIQFEPEEGDESNQRTEVRIAYGAGALYVGAMLYDDNPDGIEPSLGRRDDFNRADWFLVSIDSYNDKKTAYTFGVNAGGVQFDAIQTSFRSGTGANSDAPNRMDPSWDAIWEVAHRITAEGWVVEMRIPYSMLRFSVEEVQTWGIQFTRMIPRFGEQSEWPYVPRSLRDNLVANFGQLTGIEGIEPRSSLQVTPYTLARGHSREDSDAPGSIRRTGSMEVGGDVKMSLGPNATLDATINPDFGQVEADPAVLNLTAFETELVERRPFFVEGMQIYQFDLGPGRLPYTRRIGANAPIIGAAKLSGRTAGGLSFGFLGATTGENLDPSRYYGLIRMSQQVGQFSSFGGIATGFDGPQIGSDGRQRSVIAATDYDFRFSDNRYNMEGFIGVTHKYWTQSTLTGETGYGGKLLFSKRQGDLTGFTGLEGFGDKSNFNDWGRVRETNFVSTFLRLNYNLNGGQPIGPFQRVSVGEFGSQKFSASDGLNQGQQHRLSSTWLLRSLQEIEIGATIARPFGGYDIFETRGNGPWARPPSIELSGSYASDLRRMWQLQPSASIRYDDDGGHAYGLGIQGNWNAGSRLEFSGILEGEWEAGVKAWTSNETLLRDEAGWSIGARSVSPDRLTEEDFVRLDDAGRLDGVLASVDPWSAGTYYVPVFGTRDTRSIDLTIRSTVTFRPNLSLQLYGQFFVAQGRYDSFQILQNREDLASFASYPKRDDFVFSQLQSNTVLRWEYRPGSTLFLVWTQGRSTDDALNPLGPWPYSPYERALGEQITDTFNVLPDNVFIVKLNYTFLR